MTTTDDGSDAATSTLDTLRAELSSASALSSADQAALFERANAVIADELAHLDEV